MQQPQSQFIADFGHEAGLASPAFGLAGSGFGIDAVSEQARARAFLCRAAFDS